MCDNCPTRYNGTYYVNSFEDHEMDFYPLKDNMNYSSEATAIIVLWVMQILYCCCNCAFMGFVGKPPAATP